MQNSGGDPQRKEKFIGKVGRICVSKDHGGMGFKDINIFNQAMLAKQSWRIIKNPESLLSKIMGGKYLCHENFMRAKLGKNCSYVWSSIMWGSKLFGKGYKWRIGNGSMVTFGSNPWILVKKTIGRSMLMKLSKRTLSLF